MEALTTSGLELGVAAKALPGQTSSGDLHVVKSRSDRALVAALDGVGHGAEAELAAKTACAILERYAEEPTIALVRRCHEALRGTRGVVMSMASFNMAHGLMTWIGVGNVQGILLRIGSSAALEEESLLLRAGVVGIQLPPLQAEILPVAPGDSLILATDGVQTDFNRGLARNQAPQKAAEMILARHGRATDDALILIARYLRNPL